MSLPSWDATASSRQVRGEFPHARGIGVSTIRDRNEPVRLYELMRAEHYPHLDWPPKFARAAARPRFKQLAETDGDPVSRYYVERRAGGTAINPLSSPSCFSLPVATGRIAGSPLPLSRRILFESAD
jgi:hypothetical protein